MVRTGPPRSGATNPWMVILISALALAVMLSTLFVPEAAVAAWIDFWGFKPAVISARIAEGVNWRESLALGRLVRALFAHSTWLHLLGNLAYLWVFGIPVERALGHVRFVGVFLLLGALANLFVALHIPDLERTIIGASGGVSAVVGVYLGLFPTRRIGLWLPLGLFLQFARIPALLVIGSWFTLQVLYTVFGPMSDAVAWRTHVAGFVAGLLVAVAIRVTSGRVDYGPNVD
ncbi:MAG: rhomboid family intramembrane serine protease [Wenzhouxiangellaceae bacterium]|nr:rhomboid family intramembrane serine protease [Wenzhouxiangellaceae bacterium]MBS3746198.1 rhomboid family intramembrane serine protease [Wenzhouxiangellaceae bacterium]MBS3822590.1 rhomboid family intramembrane serine protease [Wenzhouxiangellaceae bacterium]